MTRAVQGWQNGDLLDEFLEWQGALPDIDALNEPIPVNEWDISRFNNEPRPPYSLYHVVYVTSEDDGATYTISLNTKGQREAYEELQTKLAIDAAKGVTGIPEIELDWKWMPAAKGTKKQRPFYRVVGRFGNGSQSTASPQIEHDNDTSDDGRARRTTKRGVQRIDKSTTDKPSWSEILDDDLPDSLK